MTREEFAKNTKTLEEFYQKELNYTQSDIWFDELKNYSAERYQLAIRMACKTSQYKPTLSQMLDLIAKVKPNTQAGEKTKCEFCNGTGYYLYRKIENGYPYEYVCTCICQNAQGLEYDGSKIADKEHRSKFYIKSAREVFGDRLLDKETESQPQQRDVKNLISNLADQMTF
jgi:hypothetical protein